MRNTTRFYLAVSLSLVMLITAVALNPPAGSRASAQTEVKQWVVIYNFGATPTHITSSIEAAGGTVKARLEEIAVAVAESSDPDFAANIARD
jgi:hypothetical protein